MVTMALMSLEGMYYCCVWKRLVIETV